MTLRFLPLLIWSLAIGDIGQAGAAQTTRTPGQVALLANKMDADAVYAVRDAITSEDPLIRTVAARIAAATAHAPFANALTEAMSREQDATALAEQIRALLAIRGALATEPVEARVSASRPGAILYAEWLARSQPERFADQLPKLAAAVGNDRRVLSRYVTWLIAHHQEVGEPVLRAWSKASTAAAWSGSLGEILEQLRPSYEPILIDALTSQDVEVRTGTVWAIVERLADGGAMPAAVLDTALPTTPQDATAPITWEQFGRELIARVHRATQTPDRSRFLSNEAGRHARDAQTLAPLKQLLESERKALRAALGERFPANVSAGPARKPAERSGAMRTMGALWPGFLKGVFEAAKCKPGSSSGIGIAYAEYRPDGGVAKLQISDTPMPDGCPDAVMAVARLTVAAFDYSPTNAREILVLPLDSDYVECVSGAEPVQPDPLLRSDAKIDPPRKVRDVRPEYPVAVQNRRIAGTVGLAGTITATGCTRDVRVMHSVDPMLDVAAIRAVAQWQFTPTKLDGRPVPTVMTISVNFALK
jgi:TonB family protein